MSLPSLSILFLFIFLLFPSTISFDICRILSNYPSFSTFNNYLAQTQLAAQINNQQTITVLVVDNGNMSLVAGKSMNVIKNVLSIHVILDYFDVQKLQHLVNRTVTATTLFQTTGQASAGQGFLNITSLETGAVSFVSLSQKSGVGANLIKSVLSQPYRLSVVQVSSVILPSGITDSPAAPSKSPSVTPSPSPSPVPVRVPVVSPVPVPSPVPVASPVPVVSPVPVKSPVPVVSPVPVLSPVPVKSPVPVVSPVPVLSPVPVIRPVPVIVPVASPVPGISPVPVTSSPSPFTTGAGAGGGQAAEVPSGGDDKSGVASDHFWANSLTGVITLLSMICAIHMIP